KPIDAIVLTLGTNDLKTRFSLTPEDIRRGIEALLDVIRVHAAGRSGTVPKVLLVAPAPIDEVGFLGEIFVGGAEKSRLLAEKYREAAKSFGAAFFDAGSVIRASAVDGIHFDADQHKVLGEALAAQVAGLFRT